MYSRYISQNIVSGNTEVLGLNVDCTSFLTYLFTHLFTYLLVVISKRSFYFFCVTPQIPTVLKRIILPVTL